MLMRFRRSRVILGDGLLIAAQHVHSKALSRMQMSVGSRAMVYAYQHQHRIERNRRESIRRHAMDLVVAILVDRDDRDPGCETPIALRKSFALRLMRRTAVDNCVLKLSRFE